MENLFQKACLGQLSISCWNGSKVIEPAVMDQIGSSEWLRGRKMLINPEKLAATRAVIARARLFLQQKALPFPIKGLTLVPKDSITDIDAGLAAFKDEFFAEVQTFCGLYEFCRAEAKRNLDTLFNESDYPVSIQDKFKFEWRFLTLQVPGRNAILTPELYEKEKQKFQEMMAEARETAIMALRQEFQDLINHMVDRLTGEENGKPKVFKASMIEKFKEFFDSFNGRNLFEDDELAALVSNAKSIISGVTPDQLRHNDFLRENIAATIGNLKTVMDANLEDLPRRKIRFAA